MLGSMLAVWDGTHFSVEVLPEAKSPLGVLIQKGFVLIMLIFFGAIFAWYGIEYLKFGLLQHSVMMNANKAWTYASVPLAGAAWTIFAAYRLSEVVGHYRQSRSEPQ